MKFLSAAEMKEEFLIGYDRITNLAAPGYTDDEISLFLNRGQESIIEINYRGLNRLREGFEASEKRRQDLSELIRDAVDSSGTLTTAISANQFGNLPNGNFFDLPSDFLYAITERGATSITCPTAPPWDFNDNIYASSYASAVGTTSNYPSNVGFTTNQIINPTFSNAVYNPVFYEVGDEITISQSDGYTHLAYEGVHKIVEVLDAYTIVIDLPFAGSTPINGGTINLYYKKGITKEVDIKPITHDMFNINKDNPWKEPSNDLIWRLDYSRETINPAIPQRHELISDGSYTITKYFLRYLKKPLEIDITTGVNCELDQSLHRDIVGKAVEFALENIMDPRFQSKKLENLEID